MNVFCKCRYKRSENTKQHTYKTEHLTCQNQIVENHKEKILKKQKKNTLHTKNKDKNTVDFSSETAQVR